MAWPFTLLDKIWESSLTLSLASKAEFLSLNTINIWDQVSLCWGWGFPVHCGIFSSIPGVCLLGANSIPCRASQVAQRWRICLPMQEIQAMGVWSLGWEGSLEEDMATHSNILAWGIPWTEEPSGLQSLGSQKVRHEWATKQQEAQPSPKLCALLPTRCYHKVCRHCQIFPYCPSFRTTELK